MKNIFIVITVFSIILSACNQPSDNINYEIIYNTTPQQKVLKVVELFTSESCSDCPPAEHALFVLDSVKDDVICIAEHVDYWNGLVWGDDTCEGNWVDKYSTGENSVRHSSYAKQLNQIQATPQAVINGRLMLPDSEYDSLAYLVDSMKNIPYYSLKLKADSGIIGNKLTVNFECLPIEENLKTKADSLPIRHMLYVYLLESKMVSYPNKGENCGKTLPGHNIVRVQKIVSLRNLKTGNVTITLPDDAVIENCSVVGLVQNLKTMEIIGSDYGFSFKKK